MGVVAAAPDTAWLLHYPAALEEGESSPGHPFDRRRIEPSQDRGQGCLEVDGRGQRVGAEGPDDLG